MVMASPPKMSSTQGYIEMANELLRQMKIPKRIHRLEEIGANIFVPLYEGLCGEKLLDIRRPATSRGDQLINLQAVIDGLSEEVLHVSLSHIRAEDILNGDRTAICNLLEIFQGLMEYLLHHMDSEGSTVEGVEEFNEEDESNPLENLENGKTSTPAVNRSSNEHPDIYATHSREDRRDLDSPVAIGGVAGALSAADLEIDLARERLLRMTLEADEAECLTNAVTRAQVLQRRIREYLATRRNDLDLLASDLQPRAVDVAEEEWLQDYMKMATSPPRNDRQRHPRFVSPEDEEMQSARRLKNFVEEHVDRVSEIKARRKPQRNRGEPPKRGPVIATAEENLRRADYSRRSGEIRRDILRDCYDQSLDAVDDSNEDLLRAQRQKVNGKENAIRKISGMKPAHQQRERGVSGLVKPQIRVCSRTPRHHEALAVGEPVDTADPDRDILAYLVDQFPYMQLTNETLNELWHRANRQKERTERRVPAGREEAALMEAENRQRVLAQILRKELGYNRRLRDKREREAAQRELRARERDRRMQSVRAKKYYEDFVLQMRAKMLHSRDKEETLFRKLFKEALHAQRDRIHDMRKYSRDVRDKRLAKEMNEIKSLENFYRDRFQILAESLKKERKNIVTQDNEQTKVLRQLKKELRERLEHEIKGIQESVKADQSDDYFRERNAERILCDIYRDVPIDLRDLR